MIMFASDLDRTLVYSERALLEFKQTKIDHLIGIEQKDRKYTAFMTETAYDALREMAGTLLFVPVTTRTYEQFKRIFIFLKDIPLTYAITSNGANIVYKGAPLIEWKEFVNKRLETECANIEEMIAKIGQFHVKGVLKKAESLFFYYLLDEDISLEKREKIKNEANLHGWRISLQGRKLYVMPNPVCKGEAVKYIKEREGVHTAIGAGDSLLDYDFLKVCNYSFVPSHGELSKEHFIDAKYNITKKHGVKAGEEILFEINKILQKENLIRPLPQPFFQ